MDDTTGQLGNYSSEISNLVPRKNGASFAISKMSELPPRGDNSDIDTVYFTLPLVHQATSQKWFFVSWARRDPQRAENPAIVPPIFLPADFVPFLLRYR